MNKFNIDTKYSLYNIDNYNKNFNDNILTDIFNKYSYASLLSEYIKFIIESIKLKNDNYTKFIIKRGLDTISNVFCNILYYTKNIELAFYHSQKSYYYYIEFVSQISGEQNTFLQLSSRDATMYVYKKTIFEINSDVKNNSINDYENDDESCVYNRTTMENINAYIKIFNIIAYKHIDFFINQKIIFTHKDENKTNITDVNCVSINGNNDGNYKSNSGNITNLCNVINISNDSTQKKTYTLNIDENNKYLINFEKICKKISCIRDYETLLTFKEIIIALSLETKTNVTELLENITKILKKYEKIPSYLDIYKKKIYNSEFYETTV